ncbi:transmembrane protein 88 isoform X1 [Seriola aureovittata]|uniref:transmembrane protein 88 isoform X1 n=1 Tax=Seriola aureovittata TaxID=2871759 RepID=UPI0024BD95F0|nr:transmembrane protein 88 isoform X1 [Seriola aureovittata]
MCGMDVDLDDGGSGEEEKEEEFWVGEGVKMLPPPVAHSGGSAWGSRRGRCGCVACGAALILWNLCIVLASALLLAVVFSVVLLPAMVLLYAGFLCHSRVLDAPSAICRYLDDNSCSALIILGFVMMSPLVVVAAAIFCGLLRRFRLLLLIQPISRAWYRGRLLDWLIPHLLWLQDEKRNPLRLFMNTNSFLRERPAAVRRGVHCTSRGHSGHNT